MLPCWKCLFEYIAAHIYPKNLQNVNKMRFLQNALRVHELKRIHKFKYDFIWKGNDK